jgi:hypothetical protein
MENLIDAAKDFGVGLIEIAKEIARNTIAAIAVLGFFAAYMLPFWAGLATILEIIDRMNPGGSEMFTLETETTIYYLRIAGLVVAAVWLVASCIEIGRNKRIGNR